MPDMWRMFLEYRTHIEVYALRRARKSRDRLGINGQDLGELEPDAIINAVWERHLAGITVWDPAKKSIFKFFRHEIHNRIRALEQRRTGPHLAIVASGDPGPGEVGLDTIGEPDLRQAMESLELADLLRFIRCHDYKLVVLAEAILHGFDIDEQARIIGRSRSTRLRWEGELVRLVERFRDESEPPIIITPERKSEH